MNAISNIDSASGKLIPDLSTRAKATCGFLMAFIKRADSSGKFTDAHFTRAHSSGKFADAHFTFFLASKFSSYAYSNDNCTVIIT